MSNQTGRRLRNPARLSLAPVRRAMTRNWILKLLCLALAFAVWQGIRENTSFEVVLADIPLVVNAGAGHAVLDQSSDVVSIRFRGSREEISYIGRDQVSVGVDVSENSGQLRQSIKLVPRHVKTPSRAHAIRFYPAELTVTIDREVERVLPVKAIFEGELPAGIQLEKAVCEPASVRVRGAEQRLLALEQVRTAPISLDGRYNSFKTHVAVAANGQPWTADPERVSVQLELVERVATRRIEKNAVRPLLASDDTRVVKIRPEKVDLVLRGSPQRLESLNDADVYAYVDCTELTESAEYEVPVRVDVPPGVQVEKIEPPVVQVVVKKM
ncbi:MAG: hypothetical protein JEZ10_01165 [Verrucomicrobia bacterium]|nr:hypothetical protein [Verrucomicrobiota bacterium]